MKNRAQLITYVDRLAGTLRSLQELLLRGPLRDLFGAVHLLPFFHPIDGADAGFDPIDHTAVDPRLGGWKDVRELGTGIDVMADVIVNHISSRSEQFQDFLEQAHASPYDGMFLTFDRVFPKGATETDL
ncbi:MAG TPA: alpha-amylase family glycosyl hydrolase, partial [Steroidobacteraceae bacterium]